VLISEPIWQACLTESSKIGVFGHGFTYSGHPVAAAVALETLKIYDEMDIVSHVKKVAPRLQDRLRDFADHPLVGEVRGLGLVAGLELAPDKRTKESFDSKAGVGLHIERCCQEHGVILRALGDTLTVAPPLIVSEGEIDEIVRVVGVALDETLDYARREGLV
jgi:4-aminobutyrate--pyruvate transaminase